MILITGASGFLGRRLVQLAVRQGRAVRALVRRPTPDLGLPVASVYQADIADPDTLDGVLTGVESVIHAAATTSETAPDETLSRRTNVEGTRHLLRACHKAQVVRWVQISSLSANPANTS